MDIIYHVSTYHELLNALKSSNCESSVVIDIQNDITVENTIFLSGYKNLTFTSQNGSRLIGGVTTTDWNSEGDFLTLDAEIEPRIILINGEIRQRSRYPENSWLELKDCPDIEWMNSKNGGWNRKPTEYELTHITVKKEDIPPEIDIENCDIQVMHVWDESTVSAKTYDNKQGIITLNSCMAHPAGAFNQCRYRILNTKALLKEKGTWCYDRARKKVYYYPLPNESSLNIRCTLPICKSILNFRNCSNITVENLGIYFSNADSGKIVGLRAIEPCGALNFKNCKNVILDMLEILYSCGQGIKFLNSKDICVKNSVISQCSSGGVVTYECENEHIAYNDITNVGILDFSAIPIHAGGKSLLPFVLEGEKSEKGTTVIEYNTINDAPYCGITCSGGPHIIRGNKISGCMKCLSDGAAIYCSRAEGTLIVDNYVSDIKTSGEAYAYYFDELSCNSVLDGNVSVDVSTPLHNHIAERCTVKNNIIIGSDKLNINMLRSVGYNWENNIILCDGNINFLTNCYYNGENHLLEEAIDFKNDVVFSKNGKIICGGEELDCVKYGIINSDPKLENDKSGFIIRGCLNKIKNNYILSPKKVYCIATRIKPEFEERYKTLHNSIWDQVIKANHRYHIRDYSIFKYKGMYISFFEYTGDNFERDMQKKNKLPIIKKWQKLCAECYESEEESPITVFFERF